MATDTLTTPATLSYGKTKVFKNFIDGEWVESSTGETFENRNPADTRDLVGIFQKSGKADVDAAVAAAKRAFAKWRLVPAPAPRRNRLSRRRDADRAQGRIRPRHDPRNGQGSRKKRAATCRKPSTPPTTWPAKAAACSARPRPRSCPTSSPWPCASRSAFAA